MNLTKAFEDAIQESVQPQDPDLLAIRKYSRRDLKPEEVFCGAFKVCNTKVDRSGERFTKAYLERFRETLPGKSLLEGHNTQMRPLGRFYGAEVLPDGSDWYLKGYYYVAADSPIVREIELGIAKDCSIGYRAGRRTCSIDGKMWLPYRQGECKEHQPLQDYDGKHCVINYCDSEVGKAEAHEVSLVYLGCQYGAEVTAKQFACSWEPEVRTYTLAPGVSITLPFPPTAPPKEESGMFDTLEKAVAEIERLKALPLAAARETELQKQIDELKAKAALGDDGKAYRDHLKAEMKRLASSLDARTKSEVETRYVDRLLERMPDASVEDLKAFLEPIKQRFDTAFAQGDGHSNSDPNPAADEQKPGFLGRLVSGGYW